MASSLRSTLEQLAATFTTEVLAALQSASLQDLLGASSATATSPRRRPGRPPRAVASAPRSSTKRGRRSPADFERALATVVDAVNVSKKTGLRSEEIQKTTGLSRKEIPLIIKKALAAKKIRRTGAKRSTRYYAR